VADAAAAAALFRRNVWLMVGWLAESAMLPAQYQVQVQGCSADTP